MICCLLLTVSVALGQERPLVRLRGSDFVGGAASLYGGTQYGVVRANYVYAAPTGEFSSMAARFPLAAVPPEPLFLHVRGRLDDRDSDCPIRIGLNGTVLFEGPNGFAHDWEVKRFAIPAGTLRVGGNTVMVTNTSPQGVVGMPPWFMLAVCVIGGQTCDPMAPPSLEEDFRLTLPTKLRPLPEPLPEGAEPGFALRGIKGWLWRPAQYLAEIPVLAQYQMNFLMNCYGSMCDIEHHPWGTPECNRWWEPLPEAKRRGYEAVVRSCRKHGLTFCFSMNPNIFAARALRYDSDEDLDLLWQHYSWMQGLGVRWFNIQFDDISQGTDPTGQARFTNALLARLREKDPQAQMILCPTYYWGTGEGSGAKEYLGVLARELEPSVYIVWTGDGVVVSHITRAAGESYRKAVGHRLIIWDNYPVNDGNPTLHLGPVTGRDRDLCQVAEGYMSNPMCPQNEANRIPLLTCADYAYNPQAYDPARSIGQAILHLAETPAQREVLRELVELCPGMLIYGKGTNYNPAIARLDEILTEPHSRPTAEAYVRHVEDVARRLRREFHGRFQDAAATLEGNAATMSKACAATYGG
jgi:beta-N-acetylglucosaminidase